MQDLTNFMMGHFNLVLIGIGLIIFLIFIEMFRAKRRTFLIAPAEIIQLLNHKQGIILDLRPTEAYRAGHIIHAKPFPITDLQNTSKKLEKFKKAPLILVCQTGSHSKKISSQLIKQGYNAFALAGGMNHWRAADMPIIKELK